MGNTPKYKVESSISNNYQKQGKIIINNRLKQKKNNKSNLDNKNKKGNLDLFRNINDSYDINETQKIGNEEIHEIIIKNNNFINESNNITFLKTSNNKKDKNKIENNKSKQSPSKNKVITDYNNNKEISEQNMIKINPNLYEFTINNYQYLNYIERKNSNKKSDEILSSEVTINITNSEGEFFFDSIKKEKNNDMNKNNIFNNLTKYENKNTNKINNKEITNYMQKFKYNNNEFKKEKKIIKNKEKIKIDDLKYNDIKKITNKVKNKPKINNSRNDNKTLKINNTNNNSYLLISSHLNNKKHSRNQRNKSNPLCRIKNNTCSSQNKMNNFHNNFSFKNISNNIIVNSNVPNIKSYKENNKFKLNKKKNNINFNPKKINFSYNYKNVNLCNKHNYNLNEKQKLVELIDKIPNNELKREIMTLYQQIINYNNEIIISNKNSKYNYIITFSNNYIKLDENIFSQKEFNINNFDIKNEIQLSLLSKKQKNNKYNAILKSKIDKLQKNTSIISTSNNNKKKDDNDNDNDNDKLIINNKNNDESLFKQYTFDQYKKSENLNNGKNNNRPSLSSIFDSKIKSINISELIKGEKNLP